MKKLISIVLSVAIIFVASCSSSDNSTSKKSPKDMLSEAYQLFKEGKDAKSIELAEEVLAIGKKTKNDTLIGKALTSLCRNAQRELDTTRLADLSAQLKSLAESSGNQKWLMYRAHQNAEMWRLVGNMNRAGMYYEESMKISEATGATGMFMIDHFNKSFVSTAKGNFKEANDLIKKYYQLRKEADPKSEDAYGLIALAYLLEQQKNYAGAHEVAVTTRRLFKEQNIFPEPPDEKLLIAVEKKVLEILESEKHKQISANPSKISVTELLEKYLL